MNKVILYVFLVFLFNINLLADEVNCKKFDLKCKAKKFIDETKQYQNKGLEKSKTQINQTLVLS